MRCRISDELDRPERNWSRIPFVLSARGLARERIDEWFRRRQIKPRLYAQVSGNEAILAMVSLGCGVGIVPELVLEKSPLKDQVRVLEGGPQLRPYRVGFVSKRKRLHSTVVRAFWSTVEERVSADG
jgi:LysR family positive regulator for ilvC